MLMSDDKRKLPDWFVPPDIAAIFGLPFIALIALLGARFLPLLNRARNSGDTTLVNVAFVFGMIGIVLLFFARLPLYRQRRFFTFGPRALDDRHKRLYRYAYDFIGVCLFLLV